MSILDQARLKKAGSSCPVPMRCRNRLDNDALADLQGFVERIPGVTTLVKDPVTGDLRARSGNQVHPFRVNDFMVQVRLVILLEDQSPPDPDAPPSPTADISEDQAGWALGACAMVWPGTAADGFLASAAGVTWTLQVSQAFKPRSEEMSCVKVTSQGRLQGPDGCVPYTLHLWIA